MGAFCDMRFTNPLPGLVHLIQTDHNVILFPYFFLLKFSMKLRERTVMYLFNYCTGYNILREKSQSIDAIKINKERYTMPISVLIDCQFHSDSLLISLVISF